MDPRVTATFKAWYLRNTFAKHIQAADGGNNPTVKEFGKSFNIKHVIDITAEAWAEDYQSCMKSVWRELLLQCVHDFQGFELGEEMKNCYRNL
jgi:hypothetical protein